MKLVKDKDMRMVFGKTKYDENHSINHQVSNQIQFGKCFLLFSIGVRIAKEYFALILLVCLVVVVSPFLVHAQSSVSFTNSQPIVGYDTIFCVAANSQFFYVLCMNSTLNSFAIVQFSENSLTPGSQ